jgi:acetoin utilization deacetylase AcuC-like enzyme
VASLPVYDHPLFREHEHPPGTFDRPSSDVVAADETHPERPERIENIAHAVRTALGEHATWPGVDPADRETLERVHDPDYLDEVRDLAAAGGGRIEATTGVSEATDDAARHAAGAAVQAAERTLATDADSVPYALVRPSGHHAQPAQADGYCLVNNVAVAAAHARATGLADRVAVLDWDVHPGNGSQAMFYDRPDVLVVSLHADYGAWDPETHPQTCRPDEHGTGDGEGYTVNVTLPPGTGDPGYARAFDAIVDPVLSAYDPDLLLVSAGQDAGQMDPNGRMLLTKAGFRDLGERARAAADGSLALVQEGGYNVSHLPYLTLGALEGALGVDAGIEDPFRLLDEYDPAAREWLADVRAHHEQFWPV